MLIRFIKFIRDSAPERFKPILWTSAGAGVLEALVVAAIGMGVGEFSQTRTVPVRPLLLFLVSGLGYYFLFRKSMMESLLVANDEVERRIAEVADRLRSISYEAFSSIEQSKIYSVLLGNHDMVMEAARFLGSFIAGGFMIALSFLYAATISPSAAIFLFGIFAGMALAFAGMEKTLVASFRKRAQKEDAFFASLKDIVLGFVELKMNQAKSDAILRDRIMKLGDEYFRARLETDAYQVRSTAFYMSFAFVPVGAIVFSLGEMLNLSGGQVAELSTLAMFAVTPVLGLCLFFPTAARAVMILEQIEEFSNFLAERCDRDAGPAEPPKFDRIAVKDLRFTYPAVEGQTPFSIAVPEFELHRGELVILRGSNGTGKSTFMRVFAGLLKAQQGTIAVNDIPVSVLGYSSYRRLFSIVFTDFYLFDGIYGEKVDPARCEHYLKALGLLGKVSIGPDGRFSTTDLSSGQRKRLAVISALLENRSILLFDEVAADFDHYFREYFYEKLLPELKAEGRTILAISHDDRYFDVADRVVSMEEGHMRVWRDRKTDE
ncbi:ATP-binding cassette domain-containing protein [Sutterella seckii]|uniref:ATP-binding cassette domain-containing protein n=1 Tax=Sutterella seckii TaxID=1944635 RepID=A0AAI9WM66_9BURK|nr:ATP-binding cassette domain-containing protein [Sutterella seckii]KAB7649478.1 ATP-binding cassette domain-containing protein [Sutterella seckii]